MFSKQRKSIKTEIERERERVKESQLSTCTYITSHFFKYLPGFLNNDCLLVFKNKNVEGTYCTNNF